MQLRILESTPNSIHAGYECPCGCRPSVMYERASEPVHEGCCCGNEFTVGPNGTTTLDGKAGYRQEAISFDAPWGEQIRAAWLIGPSVHADESDGHEHVDSHAGANGHNDGDGHDHGRGQDHGDGANDETSRSATAVDPVCGMSVDPRTAEGKGLRTTYQDRDFFFCGRGCKLEFDEDPERYLDASYVPSM